jgi:Leucine-rich repeat (LRR) protein
MSLVARLLLASPPRALLSGGPRHFATATRLSEATSLGSKCKELVLRPGKAGEPTDLTCVNMMCEHVGGPCACKLAKALASVPNLERLDLAGHQLGTLPDAVKDLQKLTYLNVSGNALTDLSLLAGLPSLRTLVADDNMLTRVEFGDMASLRQISLNNNAMTSFPDLSWDTLCSFDFKIKLDGNPCHPDIKGE